VAKLVIRELASRSSREPINPAAPGHGVSASGPASTVPAPEARARPDNSVGHPSGAGWGHGMPCPPHGTRRAAAGFTCPAAPDHPSRRGDVPGRSSESTRRLLRLTRTVGAR
jgi:hypothetical protein